LDLDSINIETISSILPTYILTLSSYIDYDSVTYNFIDVSSYSISSFIYNSNFINNFGFYNLTISDSAFTFMTLSNYILNPIYSLTLSSYYVNDDSYISIDDYVDNIYSYFSSTTISSSISGIIIYNNYKSSFNTLSSNIYNLIYEDRSNKLYLNSLSWMINILNKEYIETIGLVSDLTNIMQDNQFNSDYYFISLSNTIYNNFYTQGDLINNIVTGNVDQYGRDLILTISNKLEGNNGVINYLHDLGYNSQYITLKNKILLNPTYAARVGGYTIPSNVLHIYTDSSGYLANNQNSGISLTNPIMDENMYPVAAVGIRCNTYKNSQGYFSVYPFGANGFSIGVNNKLNNF
jgi:hypothetical protein